MTGSARAGASVAEARPGRRAARAVVGLAGGVMLLSAAALSATYELQADDNDGHGQYWVKRYAAGVNSWGITGDHVQRQDEIWFNSFPWASGTYHVWLGAVTEPDGNSRCRLKVDGVQVKEIRYPYSTGSQDCGSSYLKVQDLDLGEHQVNQGDEIRLWGESVYPCSPDHGQYTRWYKLKFVSTGGSVTPTVITAPADGTVLYMGQSYTLQGSGEGTLTWSYDANSDGQGEATIGTGSSVSFQIPTGITGAMTVAIFLDADGGKVSRTYDVRDQGGGNNPPTAGLSATPASGQAPLEVTFDAGSYDPDGDTLSHEWDWDFSGSFSADHASNAAETVDHTYSAAGTYVAAVRVSDGVDSVTDTVAVTVTDSGSSTIVIECEDMTLADFFVGGDGYIAVDYNNGKTTGTATASFPGATGTYRIEVVIVKEDDGQPTLEAYVDGALVDTINYALGSASREPETVDLGEVSITSGDEIRLVGTLDAGAAARVDKIIFTPTGGGDPGDTDSDGLPDSWETLYFGNLAQGPNNDYDDDGATNYQEYLGDTDPTDDTDFPATGSTSSGTGCRPSGSGWGRSVGLALGLSALAALAYAMAELRRAEDRRRS